MKYRLKNDRFDWPAGTIVYPLLNYDYGLACADTRATGIEHISVTQDPAGGYPSVTVTHADIEEVVEGIEPQELPMKQQVDVTLKLSLWLDAAMDEDEIVTRVRSSLPKAFGEELTAMKNPVDILDVKQEAEIYDNEEKPSGELHTPWSLHLDRDGTEDIAVIRDADGADLVTSRPFWMPEGDDPIPPTLAAMRTMLAGPKLLEALKQVLQYGMFGGELVLVVKSAIAEANR
jgi:hypothetical protein